MANPVKKVFLDELSRRFSKPKQLSGSLSLFEIGDGLARIYVRYSKVHPGKRSFYGLRREDLKQLEGFNSVICFLWDGQVEPAFVPFSDFEDLFGSLTPPQTVSLSVRFITMMDWNFILRMLAVSR